MYRIIRELKPGYENGFVSRGVQMYPSEGKFNQKMLMAVLVAEYFEVFINFNFETKLTHK